MRYDPLVPRHYIAIQNEHGGRHGNDFGNETLAELSQQLKVSRQRIDQISRRAIRKLWQAGLDWHRQLDNIKERRDVLEEMLARVAKGLMVLNGK